jgi:hypothetical protein
MAQDEISIYNIFSRIQENYKRPVVIQINRFYTW